VVPGAERRVKHFARSGASRLICVVGLACSKWSARKPKFFAFPANAELVRAVWRTTDKAALATSKTIRISEDPVLTAEVRRQIERAVNRTMRQLDVGLAQFGESSFGNVGQARSRRTPFASIWFVSVNRLRCLASFPIASYTSDSLTFLRRQVTALEVAKEKSRKGKYPLDASSGRWPNV
jgi:hypothetical protein